MTRMGQETIRASTGRATDFFYCSIGPDCEERLVLPTAPFVAFVKFVSFDDGSGREYDVHVAR